MSGPVRSPLIQPRLQPQVKAVRTRVAARRLTTFHRNMAARLPSTWYAADGGECRLDARDSLAGRIDGRVRSGTSSHARNSAPSPGPPGFSGARQVLCANRLKCCWRLNNKSSQAQVRLPQYRLWSRRQAAYLRKMPLLSRQ